MNKLTDLQIAKMVNKTPQTIVNWKKENKELYEIIYKGAVCVFNDLDINLIEENKDVLKVRRIKLEN